MTLIKLTEKGSRGPIHIIPGPGLVFKPPTNGASGCLVWISGSLALSVEESPEEIIEKLNPKGSE